MHIKSIKAFRYWYKTKEKSISPERNEYDENFIGTYTFQNNKKIKGFFEMYHGDKPDIETYLPSILKIAEDGQAIYEFLQNAVDCNSSHFYLFYDDTYFLAINNGEPFDLNGVKAILNIAQTTKKSCDKIGRFGIGFKLVHRLVGKNEGTNEIVHLYKGPILFSWYQLEQVGQLISNKLSVQSVFPSADKTSTTHQNFLNAPYLFKIVLTNFPTEPNEKVRNLQYQEQILFPQEELNEFADFLRNCLQKYPEIKYSTLNHGTMFFLKLGEGKKELLDRDYQDLKTGVAYSMNMLKKLQKVIINGEVIEKQALELEEFEIDKNSQEFARINPEYKDCNIKISFGYYPDYKKSNQIKEAPNFYKYFPMGDETNGFSFMLHCDAFSNEANRRKLQKDSTNKNLLPIIANCITSRLDEYKRTNRKQFLKLYVSLLLSDVPNKQNNEWLKPIFYDVLLKYLRSNIPVKNNLFCLEPEKVKIKSEKIDFDLHLANFGLQEFHWFEWESKNDYEIIREARNNEKLQLETWDFADVLQNCHVKITNQFLLQNYLLNSEFQRKIIQQLNEISQSKWKEKNYFLYSKFAQLNFFHYEYQGKIYLTSLNYCLQNNILILQEKHREIHKILEKLGFIVSLQYVDREASPIQKIICENVGYLKDEKKFFELIQTQTASNAQKLTPQEKIVLFKALKNLQNVGEESLKKLLLFENEQNLITPLKNLIAGDLSLPQWLKPYQIKKTENFNELKKYLLAEKDIYSEIIFPFWDNILASGKLGDIRHFYDEVRQYYQLNDKNPNLSDKKKFVFVQYYHTFEEANQVFYNKNLSEIKDYESLRTGIEKLTGKLIPYQLIIPYLTTPPFELKDLDLSDFIEHTKNLLHIDELKAVLEFCKINKESFFENFVIEKEADEYFKVSHKNKNTFQVSPSKKELTEFIEKHLKNIFKVLPNELNEYKNETGIIRGEELYNILVENIDVDSHKEELIDIVAYSEPKRKFLLQLSEIRLLSNEKYDKESFEYKVLNLACDILNDDESISDFRDKVIIETEEYELTLSEIPPFSDKVKIEEHEFSLAQILPNTYENSAYLSSIIEQFSSLGINETKLHSLFGINQEKEITDIFELFSKETEILENYEQLAFLFLYGKFIENVDFSKFYALNIDEEKVNLYYDKYLQPFAFISSSQVLHEKYSGISKYFKKFPIIIDYAENLLLLKQPYFDQENNKFVCPYILTEMSNTQKLSLIEFLFNQWNNKNKKKAINSIDWSEIEGCSTKDLLNFIPRYSVYPNDYALKEEQLPDYLQKWSDSDEKLSFLADLGVWTESSTLVQLRKFFSNQISFSKHSLYQDNILCNNEEMLFNTFNWLKKNKITLSNSEQYEVFKSMVDIINNIRSNNNIDDLIIQETYDFELLRQNSTEWEAESYQTWKEKLEHKFTIYLYEEELPINVTLDEIEGYVFYSYNQGNIAIDENNNIYVNKQTDIKQALNVLVADEENDFSAEDLLLLYQSHEGFGGVASLMDKYKQLEEENRRLKETLNEFLNYSGTASYHPTVSEEKDDLLYLARIAEKSERFIYQKLKEKYPDKIIRWNNFNEDSNTFEESFCEYDFAVLEPNGKILHYVECKGTPYGKETFYLTSSEWRFFINCIRNKESYHLYRVFDVETSPRCLFIDNLWEWIKQGWIVPYLLATEVIRGGKVFLTIV
ncbi:DUF3883 domain-containing protein [Raineya orbicola]|uniref:Protein NO VEIN C-terminal domain-containing protein n=1 Tax=Raineya orbicola TaxID=2016530 RepID=A0A2N3ICV0_9BACT|nr:DUF3883 domain-containing protein [Raineya orbicola]PKQ68073.1 hypothetical protein Rain11_1800 [Raineya orbicola]